MDNIEVTWSQVHAELVKMNVILILKKTKLERHLTEILRILKDSTETHSLSAVPSCAMVDQKNAKAVHF